MCCGTGLGCKRWRHGASLASLGIRPPSLGCASVPCALRSSFEPWTFSKLKLADLNLLGTCTLVPSCTPPQCPALSSRAVPSPLAFWIARIPAYRARWHKPQQRQQQHQQPRAAPSRTQRCPRLPEAGPASPLPLLASARGRTSPQLMEMPSFALSPVAPVRFSLSEPARSTK